MMPSSPRDADLEKERRMLRLPEPDPRPARYRATIRDNWLRQDESDAVDEAVRSWLEYFVTQNRIPEVKSRRLYFAAGKLVARAKWADYRADWLIENLILAMQGARA